MSKVLSMDEVQAQVRALIAAGQAASVEVTTNGTTQQMTAEQFVNG